MAAIKVSSKDAPRGSDGEVRLAQGEQVRMRLWESEAPSDDKPMHRRDYEVVGYVVAGRAELVIDGETVPLQPGDSWVVPAGAEHTYRIIKSFTAVEAVSSGQ